jgi:capsular polysaccharide biosynthesis protein
LEEGYQDLLRDIQKARFSAAMDTYKLANIEIIDKARVPKSSVSPDIILNTLIGMLIGVFLGLGLAFVLDYFDHTLKSVEDVERYLNLSVLGSVPRQ